MNNFSENKNKEENLFLDIQSPYIKTYDNGIEEIRQRIAKRADSFTNDPYSLSLKKENPSSDTLLRQKITNLSKKVVGEEIKRFAEIASKEISAEFESLESRLEKNLLQKVEERLTDNLNSSSVFSGQELEAFGQDIYEYLLAHEEDLGKQGDTVEDLGRRLDIKMDILNKKLTEMEERLKDLEIFSLSQSQNNSNSQNIGNLIEKKDNISDPENSELEILEYFLPETITEMKDSIKELKVSDVIPEEKIDIDDELEYTKTKLEGIANSFVKNGLLFRKNIFLTKLKDLNVEEFLNNKDEEDYQNLDKNDKEKMFLILVGLMDELNIDPKEEEKIDNFLKRAYQKEFRSKK